MSAGDRGLVFMRIVIAAIGKLKDAEERGIVERYGKRFDGAGRGIGLGPLDVRELIESRAANASERKHDEASRLIKEIGAGSFIVALDPAGRSFSSEAFAALIGEKRDGGAKTCAFLIGGPDGHGDAALKAAGLRLSLGALTLPHGLARVVLAEQLYRAATILSGHPNHRG
jgi:23S rRNA (pseudouridine1915-N3)-methyltransferase